MTSSPTKLDGRSPRSPRETNSAFTKKNKISPTDANLTTPPPNTTTLRSRRQTENISNSNTKRSSPNIPTSSAKKSPDSKSFFVFHEVQELVERVNQLEHELDEKKTKRILGLNYMSPGQTELILAGGIFLCVILLIHSYVLLWRKEMYLREIKKEFNIPDSGDYGLLSFVTDTGFSLSTPAQAAAAKASVSAGGLSSSPIFALLTLIWSSVQMVLWGVLSLVMYVVTGIGGGILKLFLQAAFFCGIFVWLIWWATLRDKKRDQWPQIKEIIVKGGNNLLPGALRLVGGAGTGVSAEMMKFAAKAVLENNTNNTNDENNETPETTPRNALSNALQMAGQGAKIMYDFGGKKVVENLKSALIADPEDLDANNTDEKKVPSSAPSEKGDSCDYAEYNDNLKKEFNSMPALNSDLRNFQANLESSPTTARTNGELVADPVVLEDLAFESAPTGKESVKLTKAKHDQRRQTNTNWVDAVEKFNVSTENLLDAVPEEEFASSSSSGSSKYKTGGNENSATNQTNSQKEKQNNSTTDTTKVDGSNLKYNKADLDLFREDDDLSDNIDRVISDNPTDAFISSLSRKGGEATKKYQKDTSSTAKANKKPVDTKEKLLMSRLSEESQNAPDNKPSTPKQETSVNPHTPLVSDSPVLDASVLNVSSSDKNDKNVSSPVQKQGMSPVQKLRSMLPKSPL